ncbi:MAG: hypothetical protein HAW66_05885 [Shewanella sp.]|nr:hypothetical protein [Shewanella sp.]
MQALVDPNLFVFQLFKTPQARFSPAVVSVATSSGWRQEYVLSVGANTDEKSYQCFSCFHTKVAGELTRQCDHLSIREKESEHHYFVTLTRIQDQPTEQQSQLTITVNKNCRLNEPTLCIANNENIQRQQAENKYKILLVSQAIQFISLTFEKEETFPLFSNSLLENLIPEAEQSDSNFCIKDLSEIHQKSMTIVTADISVLTAA